MTECNILDRNITKGFSNTYVDKDEIPFNKKIPQVDVELIFKKITYSQWSPQKKGRVDLDRREANLLMGNSRIPYARQRPGTNATQA